MQTAPALAFVPRLEKGRPPATGFAEFRFESDAALERALALAAQQSWIAAWAVDRARRTLRVTLSAAPSHAAVFGHPDERVSIH